MQIRQILGLALLLFPWVNGYAVTPIEDPQNLLKTMNEFIVKKTFEQSLTCGSRATFHTPVDSCEFNCEVGPSGQFCFSLCQASDKVSEHRISSCQANEVLLISDSGYYLQITKKLFDLNKGNLLTIFMQSVDDFIDYPGKIVLTKIKPALYTVARNLPNERKIEALNIWGEYHFSDFLGSVEVIFSVAKDTQGVAQVLRFRIDGRTWFRLKDYED